MVETLNMESGDDRDPEVALRREFEHIMQRNGLTDGYVSEQPGSGIGEIMATKIQSRGYPDVLGRISLSRSSMTQNPLFIDKYPDSLKGR